MTNDRIRQYGNTPYRHFAAKRLPQVARGQGIQRGRSQLRRFESLISGLRDRCHILPANGRVPIDIDETQYEPAQVKRIKATEPGDSAPVVAVIVIIHWWFVRSFSLRSYNLQMDIRRSVSL